MVTCVNLDRDRSTSSKFNSKRRVKIELTLSDSLIDFAFRSLMVDSDEWGGYNLIEKKKKRKRDFQRDRSSFKIKPE